MPSGDDALLGRILHKPLLPGQALDEVSAPNPCADKLGPHKPTALSNTFEDAQELAFSTSARAKLGMFGFSADLSQATHFLYRLTTQQQVSRIDTTECVACCKENDCGYGYISTLVFGEGEYATGEETMGGGKVDVAAVIRVTDQGKAPAAEPEPGATIPESVRKVYEANQITTTAAEGTYQFVDGRGNVITENEFVRRYRDVTGSDELDDFERHRNLGWGLGLLVPGIAVLGGTVGGIGWMIADTESDSDWGMPAGILGLLGGGGAAALIGLGLANLLDSDDAEGPPTDHYLTDPQASLYAERYNRKLLRKTVREMRKVHRETAASVRPVTVVPYVGPGGAGVVGRF